MYDQEIATFAARLSQEDSALAASVDDLAAEKVAEDPGSPRVEYGEGGENDVPDDEEDESEAGRGRINDEL